MLENEVCVMMTLADAISAARASAWLSRQSSDFQEALLSRARLLSMRKGGYVAHVDDPANDIYFLAEGIVLLAATHPLLGPIYGQINHAGTWFGEAAGLSQRRRMSSSQMRRPGTVLAFSYAALMQMVQTTPAFAAPLLDLQASTAEIYALHAIDLVIQAPLPRLCSRLLTFAGRRLNEDPPLTAVIPLSQEEVALACGLSRQTVNQTLRELVAMGICELGYGEIRILDTRALARLVQ
jgi:CRP/FNR family transcriptional regulator, cyclic AMP receptor protein